MKRIFALLLAAVLLLALCPCVGAANDYALLYDATEAMDSDAMSLLADTMKSLSDTYQIEIRADIVRDLEEYTIEEYADLFYQQYEYGYGTDKDGLYLMIYVTENDGDLEFEDYCIYFGGSWVNSADALALKDQLTALDTWLCPEAWQDSLENDKANCIEALTYFASAFGQQLKEDTASSRFVLDEANILTADQRDKLEQLGNEIAEAYPCNVYAVTVNDFTDISDAGMFEAAEQYYIQNGLGSGTENNGLMLMLSMNDRDYAIVAYGSYGHMAFTDYGKNLLEDHFLDDFRDNDWFGGFSDLFTDSRDFLEKAAAGTPVDYYPGQREPIKRFTFLSVLIGLLIGALVSLIVGGALKAKMRSVAIATTAANYLTQDGVQLTGVSDTYAYSTQTRRKIPDSNSTRSGGGGGTHINSSGFSGHSGKF